MRGGMSKKPCAILSRTQELQHLVELRVRALDHAFFQVRDRALRVRLHGGARAPGDVHDAPPVVVALLPERDREPLLDPPIVNRG